MELLLSFPNKSVAIGLAIKAASLLEEEQEVSPSSLVTSCGQTLYLYSIANACSVQLLNFPCRSKVDPWNQNLC